MADARKRRSAQRSKTQKFPPKLSDGKGKLISKGRGWKRELVVVALILASAFLLIAAVSHLVSPTKNLMGPIGHVLSTLLWGSLGWAVFVPVLWGVIAALQVSWYDELRKRRYGRGLIAFTVMLTMVAVSATLALAVGAESAGRLGLWVTANLSRYVGFGGAWLVSIGMVAICVAILAQRSVGDVATLVTAMIRGILRFVIITLPASFARLSFASVKSVSSGVWGALRNFGWVMVGSSEFDEEEETIPKPRIRRNDIETEVSKPKAVEPRAEKLYAPTSAPIIVKQETNDKPVTAVRRLIRPVVDEAAGVEDPYANYQLPDVNLLSRDPNPVPSEDDDELTVKAEQIEAKLRDFNVGGSVKKVHPGPVITLFECEPAPGVKVGRFLSLQDDLAMTLRASSVRVIAPIPQRGTVGIEVPNRHRALVTLKSCLESSAFTNADSILSVALGKDTYGEVVVADIALMPHLLIAGATGTGKSVCINTLLLSLLYRAHPSELGLILIDPKILELSVYDNIPHLKVPVVTEPRQAKAVLLWATKEMDRRYRYMQRFGVRNVDSYNRVVSGEEEAAPGSQGSLPGLETLNTPVAENITRDGPKRTIESIAPELLKPLPKIVIVIDELADLMLTVGREIEELITRLAQKARAAGIHLIVATQRPSVDVITGLIKANFPARLSFRVAVGTDSRTILDLQGAEKLLGRGDMLLKQPGAVPLRRLHGAFVSDADVMRVIQAIKSQGGPSYDQNIMAACARALEEDTGVSGEGSGGEDGGEEYDPFYDKAVELVREKRQASTFMIQRTFRIGYNRAARIIETMERDGVIGPMDGVRPREILTSGADQEV